MAVDNDEEDVSVLIILNWIKLSNIPVTSYKFEDFNKSYSIPFNLNIINNMNYRIPTQHKLSQSNQTKLFCYITIGALNQSLD